MIDTEGKLLLDAVYEWEREHPERIYLTQPLEGGKTIDYTWGETVDQARRMAAYLRSLELPPNSHIGLISKNCAHFIICDLAIWMAGHATIALYPTLNDETVRYILEHSESRLLFVGKLDDWDDMKGGVPEDMPMIGLPLAPPNDYQQWDDIIARFDPIQDNPSPDPDQLALMCYTSGSTGRPKGVMHTHASAAAPAAFICKELGVTENDRILSYLPLAHVFERSIISFGSFYTGGRIFFAESLDTFLQDLKRARPTLFISVPRLWLKFQLGVFQKFPEKRLALLLKLPIIGGIVRRKVLEGLGLEHVRLAGSGSAPIPEDLIRWYDSLGVHILEGYGMSEDFAYSHMSKPEQRRAGYVGVPCGGVETRIAEDGEIQIKSPGNMVGYYKAPEMTADCYTEDGFFRTGDRGEYSADGLLKITGRLKEIFKTTKGKYVAPVPIENLLNADSHVELSCVGGSGRPASHALLQLSEELRDKLDDAAAREDISNALESLLRDVNGKVEDYERMQFLVVVKDEWDIGNDFLTPTLKIKRNVIEDTYSGQLDNWYASGKKVIWQD